MREPYFTPRLFELLTELKAQNTRSWFEANRKRYERNIRSGPFLRGGPQAEGFYTIREFRDRDVWSPEFMDRFLESCRTAASLVGFLTQTLGLPW